MTGTPNTYAHMAQRHSSLDALDDFPTPPWAARAWVEHVIGKKQVEGRFIWEPAGNRGYLHRGLEGYGATIVCSDIFDYGAGYPLFDFLSLRGLLTQAPPFLKGYRPHWIVTNPPFNAALDFLEIGLAGAEIGVALLLRTQILETIERYRRFFGAYNDRWMFSQFVERVPMVQGRCDPTASTATAYGWLTVFNKAIDPAFVVARRHIPPCRDALERAGDYR